MNFIKQIFSKIDIVLILTVISYGMVFSFYLGEYFYKGIPSFFIELNITTLSSGLIILGVLLLNTSSLVIQASEAMLKQHKITLLVMIIILLVVSWFLKIYIGANNSNAFFGSVWGFLSSK
ncbi:hypothetical protein [Bacillus massiliglaciei]|uniref:hypothetical protein n=1 Tax=Bacillus massiliglaciei TaxID=1816693 RepID=UPI000DA5F696|nr:hypothetical protein [Bacillus massiliglaciei]